GHLADVVAIVERWNAGIPEGDHRFDMYLHGSASGGFDDLRIAFALGFRFFDRPADRQITVTRIMRRSLVGDDVGTRPPGLHAVHEFWKDFGSITEQADGFRFTGLGPFLDQCQSLIERFGLFIDIAGTQTEIDAGLVAFDGEAAGTGHDGRQRLGAAHATKA